MTVITPLRYPPIGSCVVVRTNGFVPWVIRTATRSWADHAFITTDRHGTIVEAIPGGVREGHISEYARSRMAANTAETIPDETREHIAAAATSMVGLRYNDLAIIDDGLGALGWHWRTLARLANGNHELVCSGLCVRAAASAGLDWSCGKTDPEQVTPGDLQRRPVMRDWDLFR